MNELFQAYLEDFKDTLLLLNDSLMILQKGERNKDVLNSIFRVAHTIKGNSAGVEFFRIEKVMHTMEDILQEIRDGKREFNEGIVKLLFECYDFLEDSIQVIERTQRDETIDTTDILAKINAVAHGGKALVSAPVPSFTPAPTDKRPAGLVPPSERLFSLAKVELDLMQVMRQNSNQETHVHRILIELSDISAMRNVRVWMIFDQIDKHAQCLCSTPRRMTEEQLRSNEYDFDQEMLEIFVLGEMDLSPLKKELLGISDILFVQIDRITPDVLTYEHEQLVEEAQWVARIQEMHPLVATWGKDPFDAESFAEVLQTIEMIGREAKNQLNPYILERIAQFVYIAHEIAVHPQNAPAADLVTLALFIGDLEKMIFDVSVLENSSFLLQVEQGIIALHKQYAPQEAKHATQHETVDMPTKEQGNVKAEPSAKEASKEPSIIRVPINKVDELMDMLGELLILNAQMEQKVTQLETHDTDLNNVLGRSSKLIRSIQGLSMSLRMVEIKPTLHRLTRIARDTAKDLQKRITIHIEGEETEIDRSASEKLFDPLMHLVRNAVSHGIETEEERVHAGKTPEGVVTLRVYSKRGNVYIEVEDDGQGIHIDRVYQKAKKQGLCVEGKEYTEEEIMKFIFHPGFSTQEVINNISGRGVGMNVVESEINKMGGKVEILNRAGHGAKFIVRIPMNLAVLNGTVAEVAGGRYIFPTLFIKQFYIPEKVDWISMQGRSKAIRVRDHIIPVVTAQDLFAEHYKTNAIEDQHVIILEMEQKYIAFPVDRIVSRQEIVSKPLGAEFSHVGFATGAAIMGDGNVSLILDIEAMFTLKHKVAV